MPTSIEALFSVKNQTAVITGGSGGLGREMALGLARAGARVTILGRRLEACERVASLIRAEGCEAMAAAADVLNKAALLRAARCIELEFGPADILVNAAGGNQAGATTSAILPFFDLEAKLIDGTLLACQVFARPMADRQHGVIVNVASMSGQRPLTRVGVYGAAKSAIANFTQWLAVHMAQEYSPHIRVNALAPGFFLTEQNRFLMIDPATSAWTERGQTIIAHTPLGRLGAAQDLTSTLLWLVAPGSAFVTGVVVPVDGGFSAYSGV
jgi:NAD(P)-dependent dehydrogenase (short-subunit alcohol dehydrogenase family)